MFRWCVRYRRTAFLVWVLEISVIFYFMSLFAQISLQGWLVFIIGIAFFSWVFVNSCARKAMNKAAKKLDDKCDPYPLLQITTEQLSYSRSKSYNQILLINKACAIGELGKFDQMLDLLKGIDINLNKRIITFIKAIYNISLICAYIKVGNIEKATIMNERLSLMVNSIKASYKQKDYIYEYVNINKAAISLHNNELYDAEKLLLEQNIYLYSERFLVSKSLMLAKLYLKQNKIQEAKEHLHYVIDKGNKIYDVVEAKRMLVNIDEVQI